jgi:hypothetical protein
MISSIEYNKENDGIAIIIKITAGIIVQIISNVEACTNLNEIPFIFSSENSVIQTPNT